MKQKLLKCSLPPGVRMFPNTLREALARTNRLPPLFFGYDPETGQPLCQAPRGPEARPTAAQLANPAAIPPIRVVGGATWVGILATGKIGESMFDDAIGPAIAAVTAHCKAPVPVQIVEPTLSLEGTEYPQAYWVRELVLKKGARRQIDDSARIAVVQQRIATAIATQALALGMDCPPESLLDIRVSEVIRPRGLQLVTSNGPTRQYAMLADVRFYANATLRGYWFAGNMTARGYGRIGYGDYRRGAGEGEQ